MDSGWTLEICLSEPRNGGKLPGWTRKIVISTIKPSNVHNVQVKKLKKHVPHPYDSIVFHITTNYSKNDIHIATFQTTFLCQALLVTRQRSDPLLTLFL